jgi:transcriptional regulator with XRE-family HTH domain
MGFGEYLKGELEYRGMPVKELAHRTGIPKQTIDKYLLSNGSMPPADKAVIIAQVLGVSVEYLVSGRKTPHGETWNQFLSPEMRSIADCVEPLSREKRKIVETAVIELTDILREPLKDEPLTLTPLQKVFLRLFR